MISLTQIQALDKNVVPKNVNRFLPYFDEYFQRFHIVGTKRQAAFLANVLVESSLFSSIRENMNYSSSERIAEIFKSAFGGNAKNAEPYAKNPERLANRVYANKLGNGDETSGDGFRFRGAGLIQVTGRYNIDLAAKVLGLDLIGHPELLDDPKVAVGISCHYFEVSGCNKAADTGDIAKVVKIINPALLGLKERTGYYNKGLALF